MDRQTDAGQSDPYMPLCFACHTKTATENGESVLSILRKLCFLDYTSFERKSLIVNHKCLDLMFKT